MKPGNRAILWAAAGDAAVILLLSLTGYLSHYAGREAFGFRWLTTFLPLCLGWALAALPMGLYRAEIAGSWRNSSWRALAAAFLAAPFATMLRGLILSAAVAPIFMIVLTAFSGLGMLIWRSLWGWISARNQLYG